MFRILIWDKFKSGEVFEYQIDFLKRVVWGEGVLTRFGSYSLG